MTLEEVKAVKEKHKPFLVEKGGICIGISRKDDEFFIVCRFIGKVPEGLPAEFDGVRVQYDGDWQVAFAQQGDS